MASNVNITVTINGNTDTNWTSVETAHAEVIGAYTALGLTPILETEVNDGRMTRTEQLIDSDTITYTYSFVDAATVPTFFSSANFTATNTVVTDNGWSASGIVTFLDDSTQTFTL